MKTATPPTLVMLAPTLGKARDLGLNISTLQALTILADLDGEAITLGALAARMGFGESGLTPTTDRLVRLHFATRENGRNDRRQVFIAITDKGRTAFQKLL